MHDPRPRLRATLGTLLGAGTLTWLLASAAFASSVAIPAAPPESRPRAAVDLRLSLGDGGCDRSEAADDLATPAQAVTLPAAGGSAAEGPVYCVWNTGRRRATLTVSAIEVTDVDTDCSPSEREVDATCGADGQGELRDATVLRVVNVDCASSVVRRTFDVPWDGAHASVLSPLARDEVACYRWIVTLRGSVLPPAAQTDRLVWRLAFDASARPGL